MRVAVVSEYYPRAHDPVLGVWAHRQALAARDAGADVRVLVLYRPIPPRSTPPRDLPSATRRLLRQPRHATLDGIAVEYVPLRRAAAPAGLRVVGRVGGAVARARAAPPARRFPFDLVHAHNAVPAGDAVVRARARVPLVVSVHGSDVFFTAPSFERGRARGPARVRARAARARQQRGRRGGDRGRSAPGGRASCTSGPTCRRPGRSPIRPAASRRCSCRSAHLVARKRHADVLRAMGCCATAIRRCAIASSATAPSAAPSSGSPRSWASRTGSSSTGSSRTPTRCAARARRSCSCMPSVDEAFGVAYVEAMAGGLPAIGCRGEPGPRRSPRPEAGSGSSRPATPTRSRARSTRCSPTPRPLRAAGAQARATVEAAFTWERCGARDGARLRGRARMSRDARSCSSRTSCPRTARARSRRCTSASGSSSRCSAAARTTPPAASRTPASRTAHVDPSATCTPSPRPGRYRAVVAGTAGRAALPAAWLGARRARVPFVLWSALWAELTTPAHVLARPLMAAIYRDAAAVVAYGPHVAAFARAHGARRRRDRAAGGRQRVLVGAGRRARAARAVHGALRRAAGAARRASPSSSRRGAPPALDPAEAALVLAGDGHEARSGARIQVAGALSPETCATSMRARAFWPYRRSPHAASWSHGGSSPTRP